MCAGPGGRMRPPVAGAHARQRGPVHAPGRSIIELMDPATGIGIPVAFGAGLVSFLSPCVLPLVPGYISAVAGVVARSSLEPHSRSRGPRALDQRSGRSSQPQEPAVLLPTEHFCWPSTAPGWEYRS